MAFEERIDPSHSSHDLLIEHLVRYELVAQQTSGSEECNYFDLGCGNGFGMKLLLAMNQGLIYGFDISDDALKRAGAYLGRGERVRLVRVDLNKPDSFGIVEKLIRGHHGGRTVLVCFEVLEHLEDFRPMVGFINRQVNSGVSAFLSVPNDAFFGTQNPFHRTTFGEDSLAELLQLFDLKPLVYKQCPIRGAALISSAMDRLDENQMTGRLLPSLFEILQTPTVPSHFILSFSPDGVIKETPIVRFNMADLVTERRWTAQRESDLCYYREETNRLNRKWRLAQRILKDLHAHFSDERVQRTVRKLAMLTKLVE